jgi:hypothetical protein
MRLQAHLKYLMFTALGLHGVCFKGLENCWTGCFVTCADLRSPRIFREHNGLVLVAAMLFFY